MFTRLQCDVYTQDGSKGHRAVKTAEGRQSLDCLTMKMFLLKRYYGCRAELQESVFKGSRPKSLAQLEVRIYEKWESFDHRSFANSGKSSLTCLNQCLNNKGKTIN